MVSRAQKDLRTTLDYECHAKGDSAGNRGMKDASPRKDDSRPQMSKKASAIATRSGSAKRRGG